MYPREHRPEMGAGARSNLVGFVSYMERRDAEYAIREADGAIWGGPGSNGPVLRMGWGKAVPNPPRARFRKYETCVALHNCLLNIFSRSTQLKVQPDAAKLVPRADRNRPRVFVPARPPSVHVPIDVPRDEHAALHRAPRSARV